MSFLRKLRSLVSFRRPEFCGVYFLRYYTVDAQGEITTHDLTPFRKGRPRDAKEIRSLLKHVAVHGEGYCKHAVPGRTAYGSADEWTEKLKEIKAQREAMRSNEVYASYPAGPGGRTLKSDANTSHMKSWIASMNEGIWYIDPL